MSPASSPVLQARTHLATSSALCGAICQLGPGTAEVALDTAEEMAVDTRGLVHGGFIFGLADYAAMLAVNDPNVVLGAAEVRFTAPVRTGQRVVARARSISGKGKKHIVEVSAVLHQQRDDDRDKNHAKDSSSVFEGTFTCFVLETHVFDA